MLHNKILENKEDKQGFTKIFEHIFKTREFLRQSGSSVKMLLESVALTLPN